MAGHFLDEWINLASDERNAIVFEDRNKAYGAFPLRREYPRTLLFALLWTVLGISIIALTPKIIDLIKGIKKEDDVKVVNIDVQLTPPPPVDPTEPPPPPPPPPPPTIETVKFTPPIVVNTPVGDDPPPVQTAEQPQISTDTHKGDAAATDIVIPVDAPSTGPVEKADEIFVGVEVNPEFPGGVDKLYQYLGKNITYPAMEKEAGIKGKVFIEFVVNLDGSITDVKAVKEVKGGPGLTKEAIRVIKTMPPWKPGKQNGHAVRVRYTVPVWFTLE